MEQKTKQIVSIVTTLAVIGVTVYAIKKYYDSKKQDEESIGLDEARVLVKEDDRRNENIENNEAALEDDKGYVDTHAYFKTRNLNDDQVDGHLPDFGKNTKNVSPLGKKPDEIAVAEEFEEEEEEFTEDPDPEDVLVGKGYFEEDKEVIDDLRYEPNSSDAREQFINMELANLGRDNDTRDVVAMLYDHPFVPTCDEDQNLKTRLIDHRIKFFGLVSRWTKEVTFGDLIMYYGKAAEYNCGNDVRHWVDYFLTCCDLNDITLTSDEIDERLAYLNKHIYFNQDIQSHGLFGLTSAQMTEACYIAKSRVDEKLTYDIEFQMFIQGVI